MVKLTWEFVGDYFRREIPAATEDAMGRTAVDQKLLHKGFSKVRMVGVKVGEVWGRNPETGDDLVFTPVMINTEGECWGIKPDLYEAPLGQAVYNNFWLSVVPQKNPADHNNWWPSFDIARMDEDVFAPLIKAFAPVKRFFDDVGKYTPLGIKVLDALVKKRPLKGFELANTPDYVGKSTQLTPPTIAQERQALITARDQVPAEEIELRLVFDEEIKILDAIKKYSPIVYLHPEERAGPIAPADFFAGETTMVREKNKQQKDPVVIARGRVTFKQLSTLAEKNPTKQYYIWHGQQKEPLKYDKRIFYGSNPALYPQGIPIQVVTFYGHGSNRRLIEAALRTVLSATKDVQDAYAAKQAATTPAAKKPLEISEQKLWDIWQVTVDKAFKDLAEWDPAWEKALRDTLSATPLETSLGHLRSLIRVVHDDVPLAKKDFFYIQWLFLYGYNEPYTITIPLGTIFKGDYLDIQNAHEADLEHITMKVNTATGKLEAIEYGAHGSAEGMWLYPPGTTDNPLKEFAVQDGHPVVFVAFGAHGNYPREGVYTRVYGLANDITKKGGKRWNLTENNIYRSVRPTSVGFNPAFHTEKPDYDGYLNFKGYLGPRGVGSYVNQAWFGNIENIKGPDLTRDPVAVHTNHLCPSAGDGGPVNSSCIREKSKKSPPPGNERPGIVKFLQDIGII
jgi:hypothetical protein